MRLPDLDEADLPLRQRATRHSRRELERLLARAKRAIEAFATSASDQTAERPDPKAKPARLIPVT